jgi:polysaccharide export outer membrane protein
VNSPVDTSYVIGRGDALDLGLVGRGDFASRPRVATDGTILLQYLGKVKAEGRTALELADDIRKALIAGGYFTDPVVRVEVAGISSRYVTVLGFVGSPGLITLDRAYHLSEILARVGGGGSGGASYALLTRASGGRAEKYSLVDLASGGPDKDPLVAPGDKIFIPSVENELIYMLGAIKTPGSLATTPNLTFRIAIAKSGGVTENGNENKISVVRAGTKLKGVKLDDLVKPGDVVTIGERLF